MGLVRLMNTAREWIGGWAPAEAPGLDATEAFLTCGVATGNPIAVPVPWFASRNAPQGARRVHAQLGQGGIRILTDRGLTCSTEVPGPESGSVIGYRAFPTFHQQEGCP